MADRPTPPESLPQYLAEGVPHQDDATLQELQAWIDELLEHRQEIAIEDIEPAADEAIEQVEETRKGARVVKRVSCGKETCSTCPHGPYAYRVYREGEQVVWDYQGPVSDE